MVKRRGHMRDLVYCSLISHAVEIHVRAHGTRLVKCTSPRETSVHRLLMEARTEVYVSQFDGSNTHRDVFQAYALSSEMIEDEYHMFYLTQARTVRGNNDLSSELT